MHCVQGEIDASALAHNQYDRARNSFTFKHLFNIKTDELQLLMTTKISYEKTKFETKSVYQKIIKRLRNMFAEVSLFTHNHDS